MRKSLLMLTSVLTILVVSCRKESDVILSGQIYQTDGYYNMVNAYPRSHEELFRTLWTGMNSNYAAWDIETIDWDSVYDACLPVVRSWDDHIVCNIDTVRLDSMKSFYSNVFAGLHDGHLTVKLWDMMTESCFSFSPSKSRVASRNDYHEKVSWFNERDFYRDMLKDNSRADRDSLTPSVYASLKQYSEENYFKGGLKAAVSPDGHMCAMSGVIGGTIPYLRFSSFEFCTSIMDEMKLPAAARGISNTYQAWFKNVQYMTYDNSLEGVIIDVRGNNGGLVDDFWYTVGSLVTDSVLTVGKYRRKDGLGRLDFGPAVPMRLACRNTVHYSVVTRPIVVLADCNSGSMSEIVAYCSKLKDNIFFVGEQTYGATSMLDNSYEATYSGSFGDKENGPYFVYLPSGLFLPSTGPLLEGNGVEPDYYVPFDMDRFNSTLKDNQLEKAVNLIRAGLSW